MNAQGKPNAHWRPWLGPANRCLVPFTSFAEPDQDHERTRQNIWFALDESRPLAFFAGVWTPHACVRMKSKGWEEIEAFGFLTTDPAEPVKTYHAKAMPVILTRGGGMGSVVERGALERGGGACNGRCRTAR